jgi:hypothetical protein
LTKARKCIPTALEEHVIKLSLVFEAPRVYFLRQCEHYMEIGAIQEVVLTCHYPSFTLYTLAFWAMPVSTGVVGYLFVRAPFTSVDVVSQFCGTTFLDSIQHPLVILQGGMLRYKTLPKLLENVC